MATVGELSTQYRNGILKKKSGESEESHFDRVLDFLSEVHDSNARLSAGGVENQGVNLSKLKAYADLKYANKGDAVTFDALGADAKEKARQEVLHFIKSRSLIDIEGLLAKAAEPVRSLGYSGRLRHRENGPEFVSSVYIRGLLQGKGLLKVASRLVSAREVWYLRKILVAGIGLSIALDLDTKGNQVACTWGIDNRGEDELPNIRRLMKDLSKSISGELNFLNGMVLRAAHAEIARRTSQEEIEVFIKENGFTFTTDGGAHSKVARHNEFSQFVELENSRERDARQYKHIAKYSYGV